MDSTDYNFHSRVNIPDGLKDIKNNYNFFLKNNNLSLSYQEEKINKKDEDFHYVLTNEDNHQHNIFDNDVTINYRRNRHKNLHLKKKNNSIIIFYLSLIYQILNHK